MGDPLQIQVNRFDDSNSSRKITYKNIPNVQTPSVQRQFPSSASGKREIPLNSSYFARHRPTSTSLTRTEYSPTQHFKESDFPQPEPKLFRNSSFSPEEQYSSILSQMNNINDEKESRSNVNAPRRLINTPKNEIPTGKSLPEVSSAYASRRFTKVPKSTLNINSPEFVPTSQQTISQDQSSSKESNDLMPAPDNIPVSVMTALSKNPVSVLYEFCQQRGMTCELKVLEIEGPSHKPRYSLIW